MYLLNNAVDKTLYRLKKSMINKKYDVSYKNEYERKIAKVTNKQPNKNRPIGMLVPIRCA